jgi:TonB-linked SusC/RagA family outer membrane protein
MLTKLLLLFVLATSLQANAGVRSQEITYSARDMPLKKLLTVIEKQSGYVFFYMHGTLDKAHSVTIDVKAASIDAVLGICFKDQPLTYLIKDRTVLIKEKTDDPDASFVLQPRLPAALITGKVMDSSGHPIIGASVVIKGTKMGTATKEDGSFSLESSKSSGSLVISSVGYATQEIAFAAGVYLQITLRVADATGEEVIVNVGYGVQKKINLSGAVDQISGAQIENRPVPNISSALQGQMANLNVYTTSAGGQPDATKSINIRGYTGLGTLAGPLILVDGVPADINAVDPSDVETITMLKDIASSAIYGSRAPNGVLLITTKHGRKGQALRVSYDNNLSWTNPINLLKTMNSYDFANFYNEASENAGQGTIFSQTQVNNILAYMKNPRSVPVVLPNGDSSDWNTYGGVANNDWYSIFMKKNVFNQKHSVGLDGGSEKIAFHLGLGEQDQNGNLNFFKGYTYTRYNFRANITADITKWMTLGMESSFAQTNDKVPYAGDVGYNWFFDIPRYWPTLPLYGPNGGLTDATQAAYMASGYRYQAYQTNDSWLKQNLDLKPLAGWLIHADYAYNYLAENFQDYQGQYYYSTPRNPEAIANRGVPSFQRIGYFNHYHTYNLFTSYEKNIGGHYFKAMIGRQEEYQYYSDFSAYNTDLYDPNIPALSLTYGTPPSIGDAVSAWATFGTFGRINYNYKGKYIVEFDGRDMGASLFPSGSRYHFFKAVSGAWNVSKEDFFSPLRNVIDNLKFRASYGSTGDISYFLNANPPQYYPYIANLGTNTPGNTSWLFSGPTTDSRQPSVSPPGLVSPGLTWAKPSMLDIGADIDFEKDFTLVFDWYKKRISDLFGPGAVLPSTLGTSPPQANNATTQTTGFDLTLNWHHTIGKVGIMARGILSNYKGKVISYTGNATNSLGTWYNGETIGTIWGYKTAGKFQSQAQINSTPNQTFIAQTWYPGDIQYADLNHDGSINNGNNTLQNHGDLKNIGNNTPQYQYGVTLGASWNGIDLSVFMQGIGGGQYFPQTASFWGPIGSDLYHAPALKTWYDRWTPSNPNGYFPRAAFGSSQDKQTQTGYLLSLAYWRLKNLSFGYAFPKALIDRYHLSKLRLYGSIDNLFTIAPGLKHSYIDPEELTSGEQIYPLMRAVSLGVQISIR